MNRICYEIDVCLETAHKTMVKKIIQKALQYEPVNEYEKLGWLVFFGNHFSFTFNIPSRKSM